MNQVSKLNENKESKQRPLSLTQVKRMKSQTDNEKNNVIDSSKSPQLTPIKTPQDSDSLASPNNTVNCQPLIQLSNTPETKICSISVKPTKILRKDSRSLTAVTSPVDTYKQTTPDQGKRPIRRLARTRTQLPNLIKLKNQVFTSTTPTKTPPPYLEIRDTQNDPQISPKSPSDLFLGKTTPKPSDKSFTSTFKNNHRFSINSNNSNTSLYIGEGQFDLLGELTKSVRELNQRLIRSEEITLERLKENLELKNKLKTLELKIDEQKMYKLESSEIRSGCSQKCRII